MLEQVAFSLAPSRPENTFAVDKVRVAFITPGLVRLEWAADGRFEDRQTLAVLNRQAGEVAVKHRRNDDGWEFFDSGVLLVAVRSDGQPLSADNCRIDFKGGTCSGAWQPGQSDAGNLKGTVRTLDLAYGDLRVDCDLKNQPRWETVRRIELGNGFLSRDGWSLVDDSANVVVDLVGGRKWVAQRPAGERQDWYFLGYGHDYRQALADAAQVFGSQPLVPRYALGYWWSRYWPYSDAEIEGLVENFDAMNIPIDVMVIDMDWHLEGWTGYTWDKRYFPDPDEHLAWLHRKGLKTTLNLHPADGVGKHEAQFRAMAEAMGLDPEKVDRIPFNILDPKYMDAYFEILHHPEEKRGVDFWWMDWQQGESTAMPGLDTLPWINHLHWEDMQKRGDNSRPLIFSRFGGFGAGRYNVGFSGDTYSVWESLAYQPYFTATSSNVLYGYWSHDLGGHMPGAVEPELYLRWLQFGAYSPVMRTHTSRNAEAERRFWAYPDPYGQLMAEAVRERYRLVPYIYSEDRKAYDTGVSLVRPLYYDYPECDRAYQARGEYFFGDAMLVAPVVRKGDAGSHLTECAVWLPEGQWYDTARGRLEQGGAEITRHYLIGEVPVFVRPGAVIPAQKSRRRLDNACYDELVVRIYPGESGSYLLYEDDGISQDYLLDRRALIHLSHSDDDRAVKTVRVRAEGGFDGFKPRRSLTVELNGYAPPRAVRTGGTDLPYHFRLEEAARPAWGFDGAGVRTVIELGEVDIAAGVDVEIELDAQAQPLADGLKGAFARLARINYFNTVMTSFMILHPNERLGQYLAHMPRRISLKPESFAEEAGALKSHYPELREMIDAMCQPSHATLRTPDRAVHRDSVWRLLKALEE